MPEDPGPALAPSGAKTSRTVPGKRKQSRVDGDGIEQGVKAIRTCAKAFSHPPSKSPTKTKRLWRMLRKVADPTLLERLTSTDICALDDSSDETTRLWQASGGMARVVPSSTIYHSDDRYSEEELLHPDKHWTPTKVRVYRNGVLKEVSKDLLHHVHYGYHTKHQQPYLAFVELSVRTAKYGAPGTGEHEQSLEAILASQGHFTDLHLGERVSSCTWPS